MFSLYECCLYANIEKMQQINTNDRETLVRSISQFRRAIVREFVFNILHTFGDFDFSLPQLGTLLLLDEEGELTIKQVTEILGRSVSATSRLLDQLVERGMISRREDERDRRAKRVAITESGRKLIATLEQRRAEVQIVVMEYLSAEERADVTRAMALLAEAGKRRRHDEHPESTTAE
jgi:DNA-binding MarR family transcriptional regulator